MLRRTLLNLPPLALALGARTARASRTEPAAACLRLLDAPVAATGRNVVIRGEQVSGALVEFLQAVGMKAGCAFRLPVLPRPRLDRMFFSDEVDVLFPASRSSARDRSALFVPWLALQPHLVTVRWNTERVNDLRELLARPAWTAVVVRSYSWGDAYDGFIQELDRLGRVSFVAELRTVHAMLRAGHARFTLLPPSLLYTSLPTPSSTLAPAALAASTPARAATPPPAASAPHPPAGLPADFNYQRLPDLPPSLVGMYLNPRRIAPADIERLSRASAQARAEGLLQRSLARHYPLALLAIDMKALP